MNSKQHIVIIGAGLSGCVMAIALAKKGCNVTLYEVKSDPRKTKIAEGRSYNLQLYPRGIKALKKLGIWDKNFPLAADAVEGYMNHYRNGKKDYTKLNAAQGEHFYQIHREKLSVLLLNKLAAYKNISINFTTKCVALDLTKKEITLLNTTTRKKSTKKADIFIGADGINSVTRNYIQKATGTTETPEIFPWGYKEIPLPPEEVARLSLIPHTTHRWPRKEALLIGFPNRDASLTLMLMLSLSGRTSFSSLATKRSINAFVKRTYPDLVSILPRINTAFLKNPTGKLVCITTTQWHYKDTALLIGDAAHGILPFYGQGMNSAFEDCLVLSELMTKHKKNWSLIFPKFQKLRKPHTDVIYELAKENFFSLKDKSRSPFHLVKDKTHTFLHATFPTMIKPPLYKSIIYTTDSFGDIYKKHLKQEKMFRIFGVDILVYIVSLIFPLLQTMKRTLTKTT